MSTFTDNQGREWHLELTIPEARRIRKLLGIDILNFDAALPQLSADPILLCDVLFLLVEEQATRQQVTDDQFGSALVGQALESAADAFVEALINFFPPRRQKLLQTMQQTARELDLALTGLAENQIPDAIQKLRRLTSGSESPAVAASSDTPPSAPSGN